MKSSRHIVQKVIEPVSLGEAVYRKQFEPRWCIIAVIALILLVGPLQSSAEARLWVKAVIPTGGATTPFDTIEIEFSEAVQSGTFTLADVTFSDSGGTITPTSLTPLATEPTDRFELNLTGTTGLNNYTLAIGPDVFSQSAGEQMDAYQGALFGIDTAIPTGDTTFEGNSIVVYGATVTIDGAHTFDDLAVQGSGVVTHSATSELTVYSMALTINDRVWVDAGAAIDASARGYLPGYTAGNTTVGAATLRAGGSYGGEGFIANGLGATNRVYGDFTDPDLPGSGGGLAFLSAGAGGGVVRLSATEAVIDGTVACNGQDGFYNGDPAGSGGSIRLDVGTLSGSGLITANGGRGYIAGGSGGGGRIAIYYQDMSGFALANLQSHGGVPGPGAGGVGSVYLKSPGGMGELRIDSHDTVADALSPLGLPGQTVFQAERLVIAGLNTTAVPEDTGVLIDVDELVLSNGGVLSHRAVTTTETFALDVITGTLSIDIDSAIDVSAQGYHAGYTVGNTTVGAATQQAGGSYGGEGFIAGGMGITNRVYGDYTDPDLPGSGGGLQYGDGGAGGGVVRLIATTALIDGAIASNGGDGFYAGDTAGSGGSIRLDIDTLSGSGLITANGGRGYIAGGSGGGGRIAIYYQDMSGFALANLQSHGGVPGPGAGGVGSVYLKSPGGMGELRLDSHNTQADALTPLGLPGQMLFEAERLVISGLNTVVVPEHGGLTIDIDELILTDGGILSHRAVTTTELFALEVVAGNVSIDADSAIDVSARGYLPGYTIGNTTTGAATGRAGASYGGEGFVREGEGVPNQVYGSYTDPDHPGSGGGLEFGDGGAGGGVVHLSAATATIDGAILSNGENGFYGGDPAGSGGSIRLDIDTLTGSGVVAADGGTAYSAGGSGGGGRVAVYYQDMSGFSVAHVQAHGGTGGTGAGGVGSVYLKETGAMGVLRIDSHQTTPGALMVLGNPGDTAFVVEHLIIASAGTVVAPEHNMPIIADRITLEGGGTLTHRAATASETFALEIQTNDLVIDSASRIDVSNRGYLAGYTVGNTTSGAATQQAGGSYGGEGFIAGGNGITNRVYGDYTDPSLPGSGGGLWFGDGGAGGGVVRLSATAATIDGAIISNGGIGFYAGDTAGSGGSIRLDVGTLTGTGLITATGGQGYIAGGSGGGGRIAIYFQDMSGFAAGNVQAHGGPRGPGAGGVGSVYLRPSVGVGELRIDSHDTVADALSPIGLPGETAFAADRLVVSGLNTIAVPEHENLWITASHLAVENGGILSHRPATDTIAFDLKITVGTLSIDAASAIDVAGRGYPRGFTQGHTTAGGATGTAGGSYGGLGFGLDTNAVYGDEWYPHEPGSGGGTNWSRAGAGGGLVHLFCDSIVNDGLVSADGGDGDHSADPAGSGGSILIDTATLSGAGTVSANGGDGYIAGGGGGGGRVAVYIRDTLTLPVENITADGGTGGPGNGQNGTVQLPTAPVFRWVGLENAILHDTVLLEWIALGLDPTVMLNVDISALGPHHAYIIAEGQTSAGNFDWETTQVPDDIYEMSAVFYDDTGQVLGQARQRVLINNAVVWHKGRIEADETWSADMVHVVEDDISIAGGIHLTLDPGAIVKFVSGARLIVEDGAFLDGAGSAGAPILLTSSADDTAGGDTNMDGAESVPRPGDWAGITVEGSGQLNFNAFVDVRYSQHIHGGTLTANETWLGSFVHHITGTVTIPSGTTLTIEPGAIVKLEPLQAIVVQSGGMLVAEGTIAQPIMLTSVKDDAVGGDTNRDGDSSTPAAGDWLYLYVNGGEAHLNYVQLHYGGGSTTGVWNVSGALRTSFGAVVTLSNSIIREAQYEGIIAWGGGDITAENTLIIGADRGVNSDGSAVVRLINCTLDYNRIALWGHGGTLEVTNTIISNSIVSGIDEILSSTITVAYSNVWSSIGANYVNMPDQTGISGNISVDPRYKNVANQNFQLDYESPCIDAADGTTAPDNDFMGAPRYDDPRTVNTGLPAPSGAMADMGAFEFVETAVSDVDLVVDWVSGPAEAVAGEEVLVTWQVSNIGTGWATGAWHDQVSLMADAPTRGVVKMLAGEALSTGALGPGAFEIYSTTVQVPGGTEGPWRWQVKVNAQGEVFEGLNWINNSTAASHVTQLSIPQLPPGTSDQQGFTAVGSPKWYIVPQAAGEEILILLDAQAVEGRTRLYGGNGSMPTTADFEWRSAWSDAPDGRLTLPAPDSAREVYLLIMPESLSGDLGYTVSAEVAVFGIDAVSPDQIGNTGTGTLTVYGRRFTDALSVGLESSGGATVLAADTVAVQDSGTAVASFTTTGTPTGAYDVVLSQDAAEVRLSAGLTITAGVGGVLEARLLLPQMVRIGRPFEGIVEYANAGDADILVPLIELRGGNDNPVWLESACAVCGDAVNSETRVQFLALPTDRLSLGVLAPGKTYQLPFRSLSWSDNTTYSLHAKYGGSSDPVDWAELKTVLRPALADAIWDLAWDALVADTGDTYGEYIHALTLAADEARGYGIELIAVLDILDYMIQRELNRLAGANVTGTIHDAVTLVPLGQVTIRLIDVVSDEAFSAASWYDGVFAFRDVPAGEYFVYADGYAPSPWGYITVPSAGAAEPMEMTVTAGAVLNGTLVDATDGAPLAGIALTAREDDTGMLYMAVSDADGRFVFSGLSGTSATIEVAPETYLPKLVQDVTLTEGQTTGLNLTLHVGGSVTGIVHDPDSNPVNGAQVLALETGSGVSQQTTTTADGRYQINGLPPGTYQIAATANGWGGAAVSDVSIVLGTTTIVDVDLTHPGGVLLTITDAAAGQPIAGASALSDAPGPRELSFSDGSGELLLADLAPGDYQVRVEAEGFLPQTVSATVSAGSNTPVAVVMAPGGTISGRLLTTADDALTDFPITLVWDTGPLAFVVTDEAGYFGFSDLRAGTYTIVPGIWGGFAMAGQSHTISPANTSIDTAITLDVSELSGSVRKAADGSPAIGASVHLLLNDAVIASTFTDAQGEYRFWIQESGTYSVTAMSPEIGFVRQDNIVMTLGTHLVGQHLVGGTNDVTVSVSASLIGQSVVGNCAILMRPAGGWPGPDGELWGFTDQNGQAVFANLVAGDYDVVFFADGLAPHKAPVTVAGTGTQLDVDLIEGRTLQGTVTDDAGRPVHGAMVFSVDAQTGAHLVAVTDALGQYTSDGLPQGSFDAWITDGGSQPAYAADILISDAAPHILDAVLTQNGYAIDGLVVDTVSQPVPGIRVEVFSTDGVALFRTVTDRQGLYRLQPLSAGSYALVLSGMGTLPQTIPVDIVDTDISLAAVTLPDPAVVPMAIAAAVTRVPLGGQAGTLAYTGGTPPTRNSFLTSVKNLFRAGYEKTGELLSEGWYRVESVLSIDSYEWMLTGMIEQPPQRMPYDTRAFRDHHIAMHEAFMNQVPPYPNRACSFLDGYVYKAYQDAMASSAMIDISFQFWQNQHRYLNSIGANAAGEIVAEGLKIGLDASMFLIGLTGGGVKVPDSWVASGYKAEELKKLIELIQQGLVGPLTSAVREMTNRIIRGDWQGADEIKKDLRKWWLETNLHIMEDFIAAEMPGLDTKGLFKNHVFKNLFTGFNLVRDFLNWYDKQSSAFTDEQKGVLREIGQWWEKRKLYEEALKKHARNLKTLQSKADQCLKEHSKTISFDPPPPPAGMVILNNPSRLNGGQALDPNEKYTVGTGAEGYINADSAIIYTIAFENMPTATLPAQQVTITDVLDANLDLATFELGPVGFNNEEIDMPPGLQAHVIQGISVVTDSYPVRITAALDVATRTVTWVIESYDPATGELPLDPLAGFLPPNDAAHRGEGFVTFTIRPVAGLTAGTAMRNQASIVFDVNAPITTGEVVNTIDPTAPTSSVDPLPPASPSSNFTVSWTGADAGSGIGIYDIYVSDDGAPYTLWLSTDATSGVFNGQCDHQYAFYSVATDLAGNTEAVPSGPDTSTLVQALNGDVNGDGTVDLADVILTLMVISVPETDASSLNPCADVNQNGRIDFAEAVYAAQHLAGLR